MEVAGKIGRPPFLTRGQQLARWPGAPQCARKIDTVAWAGARAPDCLPLRNRSDDDNVRQNSVWRLGCVSACKAHVALIRQLEQSFYELANPGLGRRFRNGPSQD